ncbi:hypothetical protein NC652_019070 [Populus alba x Populus x berolinensis]|nr:hypothetical protein NC652_019070 [Populus alba x Populus x berolinensis]
MAKGSLYKFLHKKKGVFKLPSLIKVAVDVSKGMNYLHENHINHKDLKAANLLMDENEEHFLNLHVVKAADFGFSRVRTQSRVMTAETGTYHWMDPEVIVHKPYDHKAAVLSFGIVACELLAREVSAPVLRRKGVFKLPSLIKVAVDVSKGMNYLHQNNIIHKDLKAANLLMDENEEHFLNLHVVKAADCGFSRVRTQSGVMTAETGTYHWMAPEVIVPKPYDHKAAVLSFGIVACELLAREVSASVLRRKGVFKLPCLIKVAVDVSKGMNYLHQNNIIHKDLKAATLLMDENEEHFLNLHVVKAADFGFSRVRTQSGVMTAETGTYHWMAPEVIVQKPYDHKAAVLSFRIVGCELLAREVSAPVLRRKGVFKLPSLIKVAVDVSKGMNYLHQNNIIHKDLKAANLLMDENEEHFLNLHVVKAADCGFSRVRTQSGVMTAETGTYHWMAPEVHFTCM